MEKQALEELEGFKVFVEQDEDAQMPFDDWDCFCTLSTVSSRHIGQKGAPEFSSQAEFEEWAEDKENDIEGFDFCENAALYYTKAERIKEFGKGPHAVKKARACMKAEADTWRQFCDGEVYFYYVDGPNGETLDSCGGFFGYKYAKEEALLALKNAVKFEKEEAAKIKKAMHL